MRVFVKQQAANEWWDVPRNVTPLAIDNDIFDAGRNRHPDEGPSAEYGLTARESRCDRLPCAPASIFIDRFGLLRDIRMPDTLELVALLKRLLAFVLLALALSPFNAPFQTGVLGSAKTEQIVSIESLLAIRENTDARALVQRRAVDPGGVSIAPLADLPPTTCIARCPNALLTRAATRMTCTADRSFLATVLRV